MIERRFGAGYKGGSGCIRAPSIYAGKPQHTVLGSLPPNIPCARMELTGHEECKVSGNSPCLNNAVIVYLYDWKHGLLIVCS